MRRAGTVGVVWRRSPVDGAGRHRVVRHDRAEVRRRLAEAAVDVHLARLEARLDALDARPGAVGGPDTAATGHRHARPGDRDEQARPG